MRRHLIVMVKAPRPGKVKTRLGRDIGMVPAAWWYRHQTQSLLRRLRDPRWTIILAVAPDRAAAMAGVWPKGLSRRKQGPGDLGQRMARQLKACLPHGPVCLIGSDIPGVTRAHISSAFQRLGACDAVFGPAEDGGFWLVGLSPRRAPPPGFFANARWSTSHALSDALRTAPDRRIGLVATLADIDTAADLQRCA